MRKIQDHAIDFREGFVLKKEKIYLLSRVERKGIGVCERPVEEEVHQAIEITTNITSVLHAEKDSKKRMVQDYRYLNS